MLNRIFEYNNKPMKNLLYILLPLILVFSSCQKAAQPQCEIDDTGVLRVDSHQSYDFNIYLDGAYLGQVPADQIKSFTVSTQTYALTARRSDGIGSWWSLSVTINQCQTYTAQLY